MHSEFAPSSGKRVVLCTASFLASKGMPNPSSVFSAQGSVAHYIGERSLRDGISPSRFLGQAYLYPDDVRDHFDEEEEKFLIDVDDEMVFGTKGYRDYCLDILDRRDNAEMFIEVRVDISAHTPIDDQFGTSDCIIASTYKLDVIDLKYGTVDVVDPFENIQGILYALGAWKKVRRRYPHIREVEIHIYQPRANNVQSWKLSLKKLLSWGDYILDRFTEAYEGGTFTPGEEQCRYCPYQVKCRAYDKWWAEKMADAADDPSESVDSGDLTIEEIAEIYKLKPLYEKRFNAIHAYLFTLLNANEEVPGLKLVDGRGRRYWERPRAAEKFLLEAGVAPESLYSKPEFISPAQAEMLLPSKQRKKLARMIGKRPGNPRIADRNHDHTPYEDSLLQAFDNLDA